MSKVLFTTIPVRDLKVKVPDLGRFSKLKSFFLRIYSYFNLETTYAVSWSDVA